MTNYVLKLISYMNYEVLLDEKVIGRVWMDPDRPVGSPPLFHYESTDGKTTGSVDEIKDAVRDLRYAEGE